METYTTFNSTDKRKLYCNSCDENMNVNGESGQSKR